MHFTMALDVLDSPGSSSPAGMLSISGRTANGPLGVLALACLDWEPACMLSRFLSQADSQVLFSVRRSHQGLRHMCNRVSVK